MTVVELRYLDTVRYFSTMERARVFADTLARALGIGQYDFVFTEHQVDAP